MSGVIISGVSVARMISSMSSATRPESFRALSAAATDMVIVDSSSAAIRRRLMPVRWVIHSSEVSISSAQ